MARLPDTDRAGPRKAPRQRRSAATVSAIVEAAARILETEGLGGFNTNAVAARAGASIGTLYQYFPSKDALIGALLDRETELALSEGEAALGLADGRAILRAVIRAASAHQLRRPVLARILDFEEARLPQAEGTVRARDRFRAALRTALSRPDLARLSPPGEAADDLLAIIRGMIDGAGERHELDQDALCNRVERAVFGYLGVR